MHLVNIITSILGSVANILPFFLAYFKGKSDEQNKSYEQQSKSRDEARVIHHLVDSNDDYRNRVRDHFKD